jgi:hypothetical protein
MNYHDASAFVDALYAAGASLVEIHRGVDDTLVATLPADPEARARVIGIYNSEVDRFGEEFGNEWSPGHEMTRDEAIEIGDPGAEGQWIVDDVHITDTGQSTITFWWD